MSSDMKKESIAFDLDDVLANHVEALVAFSNEHYGTDLGVEDYSDHWSELWDVGHDEIERRALEFQTTERILDFAVKTEARLALDGLKKRYDLYIVTARRQHIVDITSDWLDMHFPGVFKGTYFVPIWVPENKITKGDICRDIGADYLIDDLPRHCNAVAELGIRAVLFGDYGWNRNRELLPGVTRCKNWDEVLEHFGII
jgi:5'(3')-deoxyribonucleotidase